MPLPLPQRIIKSSIPTIFIFILIVLLNQVTIVSATSQSVLSSSTISSSSLSLGEMSQAVAGPSSSTSQVVRAWLSRTILGGKGNESVLPFIPKPLKYLILFVFLLNYRAWPFAWHVSVWYPAIVARLKGKIYSKRQYYHNIGLDSGLTSQDVKLLSQDSERERIEKSKLKDGDLIRNKLGLRRVGRFKRPMGVGYSGEFFAGFEDCDFNLHLSNSSYAKTLDTARMAACVDLFSPILFAKGTLPLAAAHYQFIKEIPMLTPYHINVRIGGFEEKWIYLVAEFVTYPKKRSSTSSSSSSSSSSSLKSDKPKNDPLPFIPESIPSSGTSTPEQITSNGDAKGKGKASTSEESEEAAKKIAAARSKSVRADGSVLHCFSVSVYCFKLGRLTVPARVALAFCGYGKPSNFIRTEKLLNQKDRGAAWLKGGWKTDEDSPGKEWEFEGIPSKAPEGAPAMPTEVEGEDGEDVKIAKDVREGMIMGGKITEGMEGMRKILEGLPVVC